MYNTNSPYYEHMFTINHVYHATSQHKDTPSTDIYKHMNNKKTSAPNYNNKRGVLLPTSATTEGSGLQR